MTALTPGPDTVPAETAEAARLAALHNYDILDTMPEAEYDDIARLASYICQTPVAMISLIDTDRQWFKAKLGTDVQETARDISFCTHTIMQDSVMEIPNALQDARFADSPLVTGDLGVRFYAGAPLLTPDGHAIGSLCVINQKPQALTEEQKTALQTLARQVVARLELRRHMAAQREMHASMQAVMEGTTDAIFLKDTEGRYRMINAAGARFIGKTVEEIIGKDDTQLFPPAVAAQTQDHDRQVLASGLSQTYEDTETTGGVSRTYLSTKDVCRDADGAVTGLIGIARDITQRKKIEVRLRLLEAAVENATDAIIITEARPVGRPDPCMVYVNPAYTRNTGYSLEEALGQSPRLLQGPDTDPATFAYIQCCLKECKPVRVELLNYRKDGTQFWGELNIQPIADETGSYTHWVSVHRDITARKAEEQAREEDNRTLDRRVQERTAELQQTEARFRNVVEGLSEAILITDLQDTVLHVNPRLLEMTGYTEEEMLGQPAYQLLLVPEEWPDLLQRNQKRAEGVGGHWEARLLRKDGTRFWADNMASPFRDANDQIIGTLAAITDITHRKQAEEEREGLLAEALERAERDALTGLWNHRGFQSRLEAEADRVQRTGGRLALAVMDVDNFKFFNDVYGHAVGDDVLRQVADALRGCCRSYDTLARYGGDEFVLLAAIGDAEDAAGLNERLQTALSGLGYRPPGYDTTIPIGASVGLAVFPEEAASRLDLVELADSRLRRAKAGEGSREALVESFRARFAGTRAGFPMLSALVNAVDTKDRYTRRHSEDVLVYSLQIASELGLSADEQQTVAVAALLHDVGKIGVPDEILRKPGQLSDEEFEAIKQHPEMGANIVGAVPGFEEVLGAVRHHHERWDGGGYPGGLCGEETPIFARLMAVADAFSAMTTDRPYRKGMEERRALSILEDGAGTQWDPACVSAFLRVRKPILTGLPGQISRQKSPLHGPSPKSSPVPDAPMSAEALPAG